ncbi:MAG TPA: nucleotidyl transferase AbiEii/AbiGii toxin family protein [Candidatus Angelobacter sp.]|jgi:predicted nucleotidyltransferase|nr:nucleotidyl transferase AbiEii/AbiGii toxin family protein [Candidatus Angelobacter sp.]
MKDNPRCQSEYDSRQVEAARRVLIDLGQVLADFRDCLVVVGGWVPDLLISEVEEAHVGSIDVDLALEAEKLNDGRYAELLRLLFDTRRYRPGVKSFQLLTDVDLQDGSKPIQVEIEFLASNDVNLKKNKPKLLQDFRILQAEGCGAAFHAPVQIDLAGQTIRGTNNTVRLRVASLPDFLIMKAYALAGRDKPKDAYDICYCLTYFPGGLETLATAWKQRSHDREVQRAIAILREKFVAVNGFGPGQVVEFLDLSGRDVQEIQARRAFELVQKFLSLL